MEPLHEVLNTAITSPAFIAAVVVKALDLLIELVRSGRRKDDSNSRSSRGGRAKERRQQPPRRVGTR